MLPSRSISGSFSGALSDLALPKCLICFLACCLLWAASPAFSAEIITTSKDRVSLRDGPGTQTNILRILPLGEELVILKRGPADNSGKRWFHVQTRDDWKGYVREDMLADVSYAPTTARPPQPTQDAYAPVYEPDATADHSQEQSAHAAPDTPVTPGHLSDDPATDAREPREPREPLESQEPREPQEARKIEEEPGRRKAPGRDMPELLSQDQQPDQAAGTQEQALPPPLLLDERPINTARLAHDRVNLRQGPGTHTPSLGLLAQGTRLSVLEREPSAQGLDWLLVATEDGREGFVRQDMLELSGEQTAADSYARQEPPPDMRIVAAQGQLYTVPPGVRLLQTPAPGSIALAELQPGASLQLKGRVRFSNMDDAPQDQHDPEGAPGPESSDKAEKAQWLQVQTIDGATGFVRATQVSDLRLELLRQERLLLVMQGARELSRFPVRLCEPGGALPQDEVAAKPEPSEHEATTEGRANTQTPDAPAPVPTAVPADPAMLAHAPAYPLPGRYSLSPDGQGGLDCLCPTARIARQALARKEITYEQYLEVIKAQNQGRRPPRLPLRAGLRLRSATKDLDCVQACEEGCVLLQPKALEWLLETLPARARLDVYLSESRRVALSMPQYISSRLVGSMYSQLRSPARFSADAASIMPMSYPMGDIPASKAMSADLVVRALREAGVDLQAQVHEDVLLHPEAYEWINAANPAIDHRRPRNLAVWLDRHTHSLSLDITQAPETFQPGDLLVFDTGLANGTPYDLVGLVSMERSRGLPMVFTVLEPGSLVRNLPLLDGPEPALVGHYRLAHPYEY